MNYGDEWKNIPKITLGGNLMKFCPKCALVVDGANDAHIGHDCPKCGAPLDPVANPYALRVELDLLTGPYRRGSARRADLLRRLVYVHGYLEGLEIQLTRHPLPVYVLQGLLSAQDRTLSEIRTVGELLTLAEAREIKCSRN